MHTLFVTFHDNTASPHLGATEAAAIEDAAMAIGLDGFTAVESAILVTSDERGKPLECKDAKMDLYAECEEQENDALCERADQLRHEAIERARVMA